MFSRIKSFDSFARHWWVSRCENKAFCHLQVKLVFIKFYARHKFWVVLPNCLPCVSTRTGNLIESSAEMQTWGRALNGYRIGSQGGAVFPGSPDIALVESPDYWFRDALDMYRINSRWWAARSWVTLGLRPFLSVNQSLAWWNWQDARCSETSCRFRLTNGGEYWHSECLAFQIYFKYISNISKI